jgi:hypothetical protein
MLEAVARRGPDELPRLQQERELAVQRYPGVAALGQQHVAAAIELEPQQLERPLVAALALHGERAAVGEPVDAR